MKWFFLVLVFCVFACTHPGDDHITLFNGLKLGLAPQEKIVQQESNVIPVYNNLFNCYEKVQLPLYRYVYHPDYEIFVGIPLGTSIRDLFKLIAEKETLEFDFCKPNSNLYILRYQKEGNQIVAYLSEFENNSLFCFFVLLKNPEKVALFYPSNFLNNRLYE
jgi:hypothetical protein